MFSGRTSVGGRISGGLSLSRGRSSPKLAPSTARPPVLARSTFYLCHHKHPNNTVYAENVADYFASRGVQHQVIEFDSRGPTHDLKRALGDDAMGILGLTWELDRARVDSANFLDAAADADVPVIQWMLDHPSALWPAMKSSTAENSRFLFLSEYSEHYFRQFVMPNCRSGWLIGTGPSRQSRLDRLTRESFLARDINCILPLNLRRVGGILEDAVQRLIALPAPLGRVVRAAIGSAQGDLDDRIEKHFLDAAPPSYVHEQPNLFHGCIQIIEEIVQVRRRLKVFTVASEFPVLMQSDIVSNYLGDLRSAKLECNVGMEQTVARMKRARAVVSLTHVNDEIHNRTLNGLNAGAVNIIEDNAVHRRIFTHGKNALLFRYDDDSLRKCFDLVCSRPEQAYEIAQAGFALRDDPRLRFSGYDNLLRLVDAPGFAEPIDAGLVPNQQPILVPS